MSTKKTTRTTTIEVAAQTVQKRTRTRTPGLAEPGLAEADFAGAELSDEEERVVRMARRIGVASNHPLELKYTETDRARAALLAIEREMVLKMQPMQQMHLRTETEQARKSKIVDRLKSTGRPKR